MQVLSRHCAMFIKKEINRSENQYKLLFYIALKTNFI